MSKRPHFLKDLEVREMESLDHAKLAAAIFEAVRLSSPPFRIALFGPWGSGKSTILKLVRSHVERFVSEEEGAFYRSVWFNAWEHESSSNLFQSLTHLLVEALPDGVRYSRKGSAVVARILEAARIHGRRFADAQRPLESGGCVPEGAEGPGVESIRADMERFTDMLLVAGGRRGDRRMVVFIDDLDKCLPLQALALLESIKLFFGDAASIVFICSVDAEVLRQVVRSKYMDAETPFADSYIEKIFEFGLEVPGISTLQVTGLVEELYRRSGLANRPISKSRSAMETRVLERVLSRPGLTLNPRRIKRIFNRFIWFFCHEPALEPAIAEDPDALDSWLTWLLAIDFWPGLRGYVSRYGEVAFREIGNRVTGHPLFPHSSDAAKLAFGSLAALRRIVEFLRSCIPMPEDPHLAESQEEMRAAIMRFRDIDSLLRSFGM